jgi:PAS domain S-box-containing protein
MASRQMVVDHEIDAAERRLRDLLKEAGARTGDQTLARRTMQELAGALEELSTAAEELREQNDQLIGLRADVERERQRYLELFDLAPDGYLVTDAAATIREANRAAGTLLGVAPERLKGKPFIVFVPRNRRQELRDWLAGIARGHPAPTGHEAPRRLSREMTLQPRGGPAVPVEITLGLVRDDAGHVAGFRWLIRDVAARHSAAEAVRQLAARLEVAREQERKVIAREIHDELGQALTALRMDLSWLRARLPKTAANLTAKADEMGAVVEKTIRAVRRIATDLRPPILDDLGLVAALEWQAEDLADRTGVQIDLDLDDVDLDEGRATAVFRIFQEALTNIARHAKAGRVQVTLEATPREIMLQVQDDGRGMEKTDLTDPRSLGLLGMRERSMAWGGTLDIKTRPGKGTIIVLRLPREDAEEGRERDSRRAG